MENLQQNHYLLVRFDIGAFNEDFQQRIFEVALEYGVLPYSAKDEYSFIFESSSEAVLSQFRDRLNYEEFPITVESLLR